MMTRGTIGQVCALLFIGAFLFGGGSGTVWAQGASPQEVPPEGGSGEPTSPPEPPDGSSVTPQDPLQPAPGETPRPQPREQVLDQETQSAAKSPQAVESTAVQTAPREAAHRGRDGSPVVRAQAGDWGMFFRFGGLADLRHSNTSRTVNGLVLTQTGFRAVISERLIIPIYFGAGFRLLKAVEGQENNQGDWGLDLGVGLEWHFRVWRRISPFIAFHFALGVLDPTGDKNLIFGLGFGPSMGVEYYIGDRVSLTVSYLLSFQFELLQWGDSENRQAVQVNTVAGGTVNVSYYF